MTPKEALEYLKNRISKLSLNHKIGNRDIANLEIKDIVTGVELHVIPTLETTLNELESLKKPPTVDEICKALSEQLKQKVSYGAKQFYYTIENTNCVMFVTETYGDGLWSINEYLPPHLITLIGRFYEGLEVKE